MYQIYLVFGNFTAFFVGGAGGVRTKNMEISRSTPPPACKRLLAYTEDVLVGSASSDIGCAHTVPVSECIQDSFPTQACHKVRCSINF